jgi:hypothetical protein
LVVHVVEFAYSTDWLAQFGGRLAGERRARAERSGHFQAGAFVNVVATNMMAPGSLGKMARRQFFGDEKREPSGPIPVAHRVAGLYREPPASGLRVTWLGHASTFIEIGRRRVLTDPIFSERCSPSRWVGPKRFFAAPLTLEDMGVIDAVVISHDHYDHLDKASIVAIAAHSPEARFFVPLGIGITRVGVKVDYHQLSDVYIQVNGVERELTTSGVTGEFVVTWY